MLAVELLQKAARVAPPLRVVPLFETSRDLQQAGAVMDTLLAEPWYRARIGGRQEVMIGYSDSAKDVGRAHRRLGAVQGAGSDRRGVRPARCRASRCSTGAAAAWAAAAGRRIWRCSRSRPDRSTARCA